MSDYTKVTSASMEAGIAALKNAQSAFQSTLDTLKGQLAGSLDQWSGQARSMYETYQQKWDRDAKHMDEVIAKMSVVLQQITDGYAQNESAITNSWQ